MNLFVGAFFFLRSSIGETKNISVYYKDNITIKYFHDFPDFP